MCWASTFVRPYQGLKVPWRWRWSARKSFKSWVIGEGFRFFVRLGDAEYFWLWINLFFYEMKWCLRDSDSCSFIPYWRIAKKRDECRWLLMISSYIWIWPLDLMAEGRYILDFPPHPFGWQWPLKPMLLGGTTPKIFNSCKLAQISMRFLPAQF